MSNIKISQMMKTSNAGKIKAFFNVDLGTKMVIRDCKLVEGTNGIFAAMPSRQYEHNGQTKWSQIVQILDNKLLEDIQTAALKEYGYAPNRGPEPNPADDDLPF